MWRILANSLFAVIVQLVVGLLLGGIVLWAMGEFGWESPRAIWTVIVLMLVVLAVNLAHLRARITRLEMRARITRLEKQAQRLAERVAAPDRPRE